MRAGGWGWTLDGSWKLVYTRNIFPVKYVFLPPYPLISGAPDVFDNDAGGGDDRHVNSGVSSASESGRGSAEQIIIAAQVAAEQRRGMGAGEAVEHVRVKHLATQRYLCVGEDCDYFFRLDMESTEDEQRRNTDTQSTRSEGGSRNAMPPMPAHTPERSRQSGGAERGELETQLGDEQDVLTRVGMVTVGRYARVPSSTVFVLRPRAVVRPTTAMAAADGCLGPEDLLHLQHQDTGLFLSAHPRGDNWGRANGQRLGHGSRGCRVGLTMVKSPLTTEVSVP